MLKKQEQHSLNPPSPRLLSLSLSHSVEDTVTSARPKNFLSSTFCFLAEGLKVRERDPL